MRIPSRQEWSGLLIALLVFAVSPTALRGQSPTLEQALDTTNLVWTTGGDAGWFGQTTNTHDGIDAVQSGVLNSNQTSWLETTVVGPTTLSFWSRCSWPGSFRPPPPLPGLPPPTTLLPPPTPLQAESDSPGTPGSPSPYYRFTINGQPPNPFYFWSSVWSQQTHDLPAGTNVLRWSLSSGLNPTNGLSAVYLDEVCVSAPRPLTITNQPQEKTAFAREWAGLSVTAFGTPPLYYQWRKDGLDLPGATTTSLSFTSATTNDSGLYSVIITNEQGMVVSSNALLTVLPAAAPILTSTPQDTTTYSGENFAFWAWANGSPPLEYQWRRDGTNIPGATDPSFSLLKASLSDAGLYSVEVRNAEGSTVSTNARLTVLQSIAPTITRQPRSLTVTAGASPTLSVQASGTPAPRYQWRCNGTNIPYAYDSSLTLNNVSTNAAGLYSVEINNPGGTLLSQEVLLTVVPPLTLLGSWFQTVEDVVVTNDLAYLAQGSAGVGILSVSNPASPLMLGGFNTSGHARALALDGSRLYVADEFGGLQILDVSHPANPVRLGSYSTAKSALGVCVADQRAYVAAGEAGLYILDVSDPAAPIRLGGFVTNMSARAVQVRGHYAYVACPRMVSSPENPMGAGVQILDVSQPAQPVRLNVIQSEAANLDVTGNLAFVVGLNSGLHIVDVSAPETPQTVGRYGNTSSFYAVQTHQHWAVVANWYNGVQFLDVSDPATPVHVGSFSTAGYAQNLCLAGNRIYVAAADQGLQIIDLPSTLGLQPPPTLSLSRESGLKLHLTGPAGARHAIEYTDQLTAPQWQPLHQLTLTNGPVVLDAPPATNSHRFFRARLN